MGYYIQGPILNKAHYIIESYGARSITEKEAAKTVEDKTKAVICVVQNRSFDAAGFCYDKNEFEAFADASDTRPKTWLEMSREKAKELTGFDRD